jgi:hypothetical protein
MLTFKGYLLEMAFPCDARNHRNAISNENETTKWLEQNACKIFPELKNTKYKVVHKGGTGSKADNVIITQDGKEIHISDKQKIAGLGGSSDWTNSSAPINQMLKKKVPAAEPIANLMKQVADVRKKPLPERQHQIDKFRDYVKDASNKTLSNLTSKDLEKLIRDYLIEPNKNQIEIFTDSKNKERHIFSWKDHPVVELLNQKYKPFIQVKGRSSSATIKFKKGEDIKDIGLRIRIHTNNGISALLNAGSGKNKNSSFVVKFQQDSIPKLLKAVNAKTFK